MAAVLTVALGSLTLYRAARHSGAKPLPAPQADEAENELEEALGAIEWRRLTWLSKDGTIDQAAYLRERNKLKAQRTSGAKPLTTQAWSFVGPEEFSGRIPSIAIDRNNTSRIFAGSAGGGVWSSSDRGATWGVIDDWWSYMSVGAVAIHPTNSSIIYAACGENNYASRSTRLGDSQFLAGYGMMRSTNGGITWSSMPSTVLFGEASSVVIDKNQPQQMYVSTFDGLEVSNDGGTTWSVPVAHQTLDVNINPSNSAKLLAAVIINGVYKVIETSDRFATWSVVLKSDSSPLASWANNGRMEVEYAADGNTAYVAMGTEEGDVIFLKSTDGGHTFAEVSTQSWSVRQMWYDNALWVDPTNANHLVHGALDVNQSLDGGQTWSKIASWTNNLEYPDCPHGDVHCIQADPGYNGTTNRTIYVATDGGIFRANDVLNCGSFEGWTRLNKGLGTTQAYGVAGDNEGAIGHTSQVVVGGFQDDGTMGAAPNALPNGNYSKNVTLFGGDGGYVAIDPGGQYVYGEYQRLQIRRVNIWATTATPRDITGGPQPLEEAGSSGCNFIAPFILSPTNPDRLWAGGQQLWRTNNARDATPAWTSVRPAGSAPISAIAEAPSNPNIVWVGQNDGVVQMTTNALDPVPTWTTAQTFGTFVGRIAIHPTDPNHLYVALGGWGSLNLWETYDGGQLWYLCVGFGSNALPQAPIHGMAIDPLAPDHLFIATEHGVYYSANDGGVWTTNAFGPAGTCVFDVQFIPGTRTLLAATYGRGIWSTTVPVPVVLSGITASPHNVIAGGSMTGTVELATLAPTDTAVSLSSSDPAAVVPTSVVVPAGAWSAPFTITTRGVNVSTPVFITASLYGASVETKVGVQSGFLSAFTLSSPTVVGGRPAYATVTISGLAGPSGRSITIDTDNVNALPSSQAVIPQNQNSVQITIPTRGVDAPVTANLRARELLTTKTAALTLNPARILSMVPAAPTAAGGRPKIKVYLDGKAGPSGRVVNLSSDNATALTVPSTLTFSNQQGEGSFLATCLGVDTQADVKVFAALAGQATCIQSVQPAALSSLALSPTSVVGGNQINASLVLNGPAGPTGLTFTLTSDTPSAVPSTPITILPGRVNVGFHINTLPVDATVTAHITATGPGGTKTSSLTVRKPSLVGEVTLNPTEVIGGNSSTATLTLSGRAGPSGVTATLSSTSSKAQVPASVTFAPGTSTKTFTVTTTAPASKVKVTIKAVVGKDTVTGNLDVKPLP